MNKNYATKLLGLACFILMLNSCRKVTDDMLNSGNATNVPDQQASADHMFPKQTEDKYVANELLIKFKPGTPETVKNQLLQRMNMTVSERIYTKAMESAGEKESIYRVHTPLEVSNALNALQNTPEIETAEPNFIYTYGYTANDPYFTSGRLWGMYGPATSPSNAYGSQAASAWAAGHIGSSSVVVGVIDEGIMNTHEDLAANCWVNPYDPRDGVDNDGNGYVDDINGWDFVSNDRTTFDGVSDDHATHVAGTIGAMGNNSKGVAGMCWNVKMISCKFLGSYGGTTANAVKAIDYITDMKTRHAMNIVATNNSWGGGGYSSLLYAAIARSDSAGILFIAAAGNNSSNNNTTAFYPASYTNDNIIAVAAINSSGNLSSFSNYGPTAVDIGAPGEAIYSTLPGRGSRSSVISTYGSYSGTSMATPHVTGAAALYAASHPGSTAATIKAAILGAATPTPSLSGKCVTGGRLNVSGF